MEKGDISCLQNVVRQCAHSQRNYLAKTCGNNHDQNNDKKGKLLAFLQKMVNFPEDISIFRMQNYTSRIML